MRRLPRPAARKSAGFLLPSLTTLLILGALVVVAPTATAAVAKSCESQPFTNSATYEALQVPAGRYGRYVKPSYDGSYAFSLGYDSNSPPTTQDDSISYKLGTNCGVAWSQAFTCPDDVGTDDFQCVFSPPIPDPAGGYSHFTKTTVNENTHVGQQHQRLSGQSGNTYAEIPNYDVPVAERFGATNVRNTPWDADAFLLNGVVNLVTVSGSCCTSLSGTDGRIRVWDDDSFEWGVDMGGTVRPTAITAQSGGVSPQAFITSATSSSYSGQQYNKLDLTTMAVSASITSGSAATFGYAPMRQGYGAESDSVFAAMSVSGTTGVRIKDIDIAAWTAATTELLIGGVSFVSATHGTILDWDLDGNNDFLFCGVQPDGTGFKLWKGDRVALTVTELYSEEGPGWSGYRANGCKFDYNGGFWVHATGSCTGAGAAGSSNCMKAIRFTNGDSFVDPTFKDLDLSVYAGLDDVGGGGPTDNNPVAASQQLFADSWGISFEAAGWMFGLLIMSLFMFAVIKRSSIPLVVALFALLAIGFCVMLGLFPEWLLFVVIFLVIAVAGLTLFASRGSGDEGA